MTVGIPGAGIGGLFYVANALRMPFREFQLWRKGLSTRSSRRMVLQHFMVALGILASMWGAAWLLARAITTQTSVGKFFQAQAETVKNVPYFLSISTFVAGIITLLVILASVHILRIAVSRQWQVKRVVRRLITTMFCLMIIVIFASSQNTDARLADASKRIDTATAEQEYRAILRADPDQSRATFRLAQLLERRDPVESEKLYRRYVELEPDDPWGSIALADFLESDGRDSEALEQYSNVARQTPAERDAVYGYAQILARTGHTDRAIEVYEQWLTSRPDDHEAWQELARERQRAGRFESAEAALASAHKLTGDATIARKREALQRATAPAIEPALSFSQDSDGSSKISAGLRSDVAVSDNARLGISFGRATVSDNAGGLSLMEAALNMEWRPRAMIRFEAAAGAVSVDKPTGTGTSQAPLLLTAKARFRARVPGDAARFDFRFQRALLDATPLLVRSGIIRNEIQARPDLALFHGFRVRGLGKAAWIEGGGEANTRYVLGGGLAWNPVPTMELSGNASQLTYDHPAEVGYFTPRRVQSVEAGCYAEFEGEELLVAFDLGAGVERVRQFGTRTGAWAPALRGYAMFAYKLQPGRELRLELEGYNTQASAIVVPSPGWKYGSLSLSFRWALGG